MGKAWYSCRRFISEEHGVTSLEYAMLAVLIATLCVTILTAVSINLLNLYTTVCNAVSNVAFGIPSC
jgi:Flp pilus assembly pilin Flp